MTRVCINNAARQDVTYWCVAAHGSLSLFKVQLQSIQRCHRLIDQNGGLLGGIWKCGIK